MSAHNILFSILKKKITLNYPKSAAKGYFQGTQKRVRNIRGKRAIRVRAIEVLLYIYTYIFEMLAKTYLPHFQVPVPTFALAPSATSLRAVQ